MKIQNIPLELVSLIAAEVANPPKFARVCKRFRQASEKSFELLLANLTSRHEFKSFHQKMLQSIPFFEQMHLDCKGKIKTIYHQVINSAVLLEGGGEKIRTTNIRYQGTLDLCRLTEIHQWSEKMHQAEDLVDFYRFVLANHDPQNKLLKTISKMGLSLIEKAKIIRGHLEVSERTDCFKKVKTLEISRGGLKSVPPEICKLTKLSSLYLSKNQIHSVSKEIGNLDQLKFLYLSKNRMETIPAEIGNLGQLTHLELSHNQLSSIPQQIEKLQNLTFLQVDHNQLKTIPECIFKLHNLKTLIFAKNKIKELPKHVTNLRNLEYLSLTGNKLTFIPESIKNLTNLQTLAIATNPLEDLPAGLKALGNLKEIYLDPSQITLLSSKNFDFKRCKAALEKEIYL